MKNIEIILLRDRPELADGAARWFHEKWGIPEEAYRESIGASLPPFAAPYTTEKS